MGIPEEHARHFEASLRTGGVLVTAAVFKGKGVAEARALLERDGGDLGANPAASSMAQEATP